VVVADIDIKEQWSSFLEFLMRDRPNLGSFLALGYIASNTTSSVDLRFAPTCKFQFTELTKQHNRNELLKKLREFAGATIDIRMSLETEHVDIERQDYSKQIGSIPSTIQDEIENEPIIQTVLDIFDGEVLN